MRKPPKRESLKYCLLRDYEVRDLLCSDKIPDCNGNHHAHLMPEIAAELERQGKIERVQHRKIQYAYRRANTMKSGQGKIDPLKAPTLIFGEMQANAGLYGRSRTARLSDLDKNLRIAQGLPAEDFVERAEFKVDLWPMAGDDKAIRVGPTAEPEAIKLAADLSIQGQRERGYSVTRV